jgi:DNA segregation ATPase FtsK/SpoIIIE, S-DNA-T family
MNPSELIGLVAAASLREQFAADSDSSNSGTGRFVIDGLNPEQTAAVAIAVLNDEFLSARIELKLPETFLAGFGVPASALTTFPATHFRNAACPKEAFLLAIAGSDQQQSLQEAVRLGAPELQARPDLWIKILSEDLALTAEKQRWWEKALAALRDLRVVSIERFAMYALRTRSEILTEGLPIIAALGSALPTLRLPRDTCYFNGVKEKSRNHTSAWKALFNSAIKRRGILLAKQTSSQLVLSEDELTVAFAKVNSAISQIHHPTILRFISAPGGWNNAAEALAECEWEEIKPLFDGMQRERFDLGRETLRHFDELEPELMDDDDRDFLRRLVARGTTEHGEEDIAFYEAHRNEIKQDRKLKSAWDRFIFGRPHETSDFLAGLAAVMESLCNRTPAGRNKRLRVRCDRATKRDLKDLNVDAGLFFAFRYAGIRKLLGERVRWDVGELFSFAKLVEGWKMGPKGSLNRSRSKAALRLKFLIDLDTDLITGGTVGCQAQMVWIFDPDSVPSQLLDDWLRLESHPLVLCRTTRELSGAKSKASPIDLANAATFVASYDRDRGSFVPAYKKERDIALAWRANLEACQIEDARVKEELKSRFDRFEGAYSQAIRGFSETGAGGDDNVVQARYYAQLLDSLIKHGNYPP